MSKLHAFLAGLFLGYLAHDYQIARDPRDFMDRLRAQLQREEGVAQSAPETASPSAEA